MNRIIIGNYTAEDTDGGFEFGNIPSRYGATPRYFTKGGKAWMPIFGEYHFSRDEARNWDKELSKMKAQGLNGVAVYVFWNHHEVKKGIFDFSGNNDIAQFLKLCRERSMAVLLRIGPWCHGEARFGGFPDYIMAVAGARKSTPKYMAYVKRYWTRLYEQVKEYCDGETVIGLQMENEYTGHIDHIRDLRALAEEVGFKVPFFTMTGWPTNTPDKRFVPMFGGYPEAPWTYHKRPLTPNRRFAICEGRSEAEIGEDLIKEQKNDADFSDFPYAMCETGTGNQVTNHRRPVISEADGYGVAFAKFASGVTWLGYYMYHGGRNPIGRLLQESRRTFYPNNYPIVDYDFQAPVSKDGYVRAHGDRLRLMHYLIADDEEFFAESQAFFPKERSMPYISARVNAERGYIFVCNYERNEKPSDADLSLTVKIDGRETKLPAMNIPYGSMLVYPYNCVYGGVKFDYITAEPIASANYNGQKTHFFMKFDGIKCIASADGKAEEIDSEYSAGDSKLVFLTEKEAKRLYIIDGKAIFSDGAVYGAGDKVIAELRSGDKIEVNGDEKALPCAEIKVDFAKTKRRRLPYNSYMHSFGRREYYRLFISKEELEKYDDIELNMSFKGLNLQMFEGDKLVDDYFNTDGVFTTRLKRLYKGKDLELIIRVCASTSVGAGRVYNEIGMRAGEIDLKIKEIREIKYLNI